jgi:hypothetical protein
MTNPVLHDQDQVSATKKLVKAAPKNNEPAEEQPRLITLVEDVDTDLDSADAQEAPVTAESRFNLDEDTLGPGQALHEEKVDPIVIDFGDPGPTEWFRIDPDRTATVVMAKVTPPGADRPKLFYVPKGARDIPELVRFLRYGK